MSFFSIVLPECIGHTIIKLFIMVNGLVKKHGFYCHGETITETWNASKVFFSSEIFVLKMLNTESKP